MEDDDLLTAAKNAAATIGAIYQWLERVEAAGGATSLSGVAACNAMLKSLRKNADRTESLVMAPLRRALIAHDNPRHQTPSSVNEMQGKAGTDSE